VNTLTKRLALFVCIMVISALACNAPTKGEDLPEVDDPNQDSYPSGLTNVEISPRTGKGTFSVTVAYFWRLGDSDFKIVCTYPGMDGKPDSETMELSHKSSETTISIYVDIPGTYNISCTDNGSHYAAAVFTVTGEPEAASEETKPVKFKNARIAFDGTRIKFDNPPPGDATAAWLRGYCFPPEDFQNNGKSYFTVAEDGKLEGRCSVDAGKDHILGEITGNYYSSKDDVIFHLEARHKTFDDEANYWLKRIVIDGSGPLKGDAAGGSADFSVTCEARGWWDCGKNIQNLKVTGTVPFTITFLP
jgi:hypothetical protein